MFTKSAAFYDAIYAAAGKDYAREARRLHEVIQQYKRSSGRRLLDVACGTGNHLAELRQWYEVAGLDLDQEMLAIARQRCPGVPLHRADMASFDLGRQFDAVVCLFSSIGYVKTVPRLQQTLVTMRRHLHPGGVVIIEPWITPDKFIRGHFGAVFVDQPDLKIARMNTSRAHDRVSFLDFHYLVATADGIAHFTERHELGLFAHEEYIDAFRGSGLEVIHDLEGLMGRGMYIGLTPPT